MSEVELEDILDKKNGLYQLANGLNWEYLISESGSYYAEGPRDTSHSGLALSEVFGQGWEKSVHYADSLCPCKTNETGSKRV